MGKRLNDLNTRLCPCSMDDGILLLLANGNICFKMPNKLALVAEISKNGDCMIMRCGIVFFFFL